MVVLVIAISPPSWGSTNRGQPGQPVGDDLFAAVAQQVPAFAGMYIDEGTQTLCVWLTDHGQSLPAAVEALQITLGRPDLADLTPVFVQAQYSFTQLKAWSDQMLSVLSTEGVVYTDIDDGANRLEVGVEDLATAPAVQAQLDDLGIPRAAVNIVETDPATTLTIKRHPSVAVAVVIAAATVSIALLTVVALRRKRGTHEIAT